MYEYVCTFGKKYDKTKINLVKELNSIIVNKSYEEKNSYNIVAQLLIPLIVYSLTPDDFEFDLDSYEKSPRADSYFGKTKTSLIKKVNNFIIKLVRNSNCDISENLDNYRKNTHLNYSKHRIFYTVEDLKQIITTSVKPSDQIKQLNSSISNYSLDQSKYIKELELKLEMERKVKESEKMLNKELLERIEKHELHIETLLKINEEFSEKISKLRDYRLQQLGIK